MLVRLVGSLQDQALSVLLGAPGEQCGACGVLEDFADTFVGLG